ncbi:MAG: hypothetical protein GX638_07290 [Crenarchaeota archaeon]|nr:hypothetical protein [Thermoproteota archaeon]
MNYSGNSAFLTFYVNEPTSWIGYSLNGQSNITISTNTTLQFAAESNTLTIYANDTSGNYAKSNTVNFTSQQTENPSSPSISATLSPFIPTQSPSTSCPYSSSSVTDNVPKPQLLIPLDWLIIITILFVLFAFLFLIIFFKRNGEKK